jgi:signal transduction histidine kinase
LLEDTATKDWTAEQHNFLRMMTGAVGQMTTLVDGLLDYASIRAGKLRLVRRVHDVVTFVRVLHESMLPYFKERKQELQLDLEFAPGEALEISFDEKRLRQVLMNLLTNASKYSKPGQPINLRARQITHALRIEVIDMGAGIPEGDLSKIFTTFYRVDNDSTRTTSGMGLGLPIAHELIKAHGGTLGVRSELGKGSVFFIDLPLESPAPTTEDLDLPDLVR